MLFHIHISTIAIFFSIAKLFKEIMLYKCTSSLPQWIAEVWTKYKFGLPVQKSNLDLSSDRWRLIRRPHRVQPRTCLRVAEVTKSKFESQTVHIFPSFFSLHFCNPFICLQYCGRVDFSYTCPPNSTKQLLLPRRSFK